jgi:hypothetical protein
MTMAGNREIITTRKFLTQLIDAPKDWRSLDM